VTCVTVALSARSPPKPWERNGPTATPATLPTTSSTSSNTVASTTATTTAASQLTLPERPQAFGSPSSTLTSPYSLPYGAASPYSAYSGGYGGIGSYGSSYGGLGSYGGIGSYGRMVWVPTAILAVTVEALFP
jgi:peroxin-13